MIFETIQKIQGNDFQAACILGLTSQRPLNEIIQYNLEL
jgi:hypothetical protein